MGLECECVPVSKPCSSRWCTATCSRKVCLSLVRASSAFSDAHASSVLGGGRVREGFDPNNLLQTKPGLSSGWGKVGHLGLEDWVRGLG